jgi:endonuclease/exonuclease/phosphatase (EEP) superfamily protein YafD
MSRRNVLLVAFGILPWTWLLLRDRLGTLGDMVSLGLPLLAPIALVLVASTAVWMRPAVTAAWCASWALALGLFTLGPRLPTSMGEPVDPISFAVANVRFDNPTMAAGVADVLAVDVDVLVVPEATPEVRRLLEPHFAHHEWLVQERRPYGVAVFSQFPLEDVRIDRKGNGVVRVAVDAPHPFVLLATHLHRPSFNPQSGYVSHGEHYREVVAVRDDARAEERHTGRPVVIAGDLNLSDRVRGYRLMGDSFTDVARDGWAGNTYHGGMYRYFLLRIDHVFASDGWCGDGADEFSVTGSDHRGVRLELGPCG